MATFAQIADRLSGEAEALYVRMVEAHLASTPGSRWFQPVRTGSGVHVIFSGDAAFDDSKADESDLQDLVGLELLRPFRSSSRGDPIYDIPGQSVRFYRFLRNLRGRPVDTVEIDARTLVDSAAFAARHPTVAEHLAEALDLLWSDRTDKVTVSDLGSHLRNAIIDVVDDSIGGPPTGTEMVKARMDGWAKKVRGRQALAVRDLVVAALTLDQRLVHLRDENSKEKPLTGWSELRRAVYLTITACYEVDHADEIQRT